MSGPTDADAQAVLRSFRLAGALAEPHGGGFSGARLWRVRSDRGEFCLKAWPPAGMTPARHAEIARLLLAARQSGLSFVPSIRGSACVRHAGQLWDLADWMPGTADFHANPTPARLRAACTALARLHRAWEPFGSNPQPCPAVIRRLVAAGEWIDGTGSATWLLPRVAADPVSPWAERAWVVVDRLTRNIRHVLEPWRTVLIPVQPCLCDVWHDHVLFTGDEVTGLIDYGAVKPDNVAADLARLLGSLVGDDAELYERGLDAYDAMRPLSSHERQLVSVLDRTGVVLGLANWLRRLYQLGEEQDDRVAVARRIEGLVRRAENWASVEP